MSANVMPLMTVDDLDAMPDDEYRYEIIEGELFMSRSPGLTHQRVSMNLAAIFTRYLDLDPIGEIIATTGLIFTRFSAVIPDLVFFTHESKDRIESNDRLVAAPDIVIEILSHGAENISRDRVAKFQLYAKHGVQEYWIVDIDNRALEVFCHNAGTYTLAQRFSLGDEFTSELLPGFRSSVADIFRF